MAENRWRVLVGDDLGYVKGVDLKGGAEGAEWASERVTRFTNEKFEETEAEAGLEDTSSRSGAVVSVCALPQGDLETPVAIGRKSGRVDLLDASTGSYLGPPLLRADTLSKPDSELLGLRSCSPGLVSCTSGGIVELWRWENSESGIVLPAEESDAGLDTVAATRAEPSKGGSVPGRVVEAFEVSSSGSGTDVKIATGGRENNLKVWDLETGEAVFVGRSPKPNELGIWDKPWITCMSFLPQASPTSQVILCGTANHQLRLYDWRVKRRPVMELEWGENRITCLCLDDPGVPEKVWCANAIGQIRLLDLKMNYSMTTSPAEGMSMAGSLKGSLGCVKSLQRPPDASKPLLLSCGLDRFVRVFDLRKRKQVCSVYLKQYLKALHVVEAEEVQEAAPARSRSLDDVEESEYVHEVDEDRKRKKRRKGSK
ncbi:WD40 repeat domain-containing protein [Chloropicon primus]|uniref:WD40 repeat domain-containing protein n=1 Tax=Chloropicon primus TaxID=1764295 RepID=A0A5B8MJ08_9CHLO|nr:WD40 repeat domain-containing protein [Chloropicon primus]UPQ99652.1 WD40 repeat domain-containing protein [Chloropicon primus]|eukprot:QDZ20443.1 WD40 repeat domain-containing protein [Chloropicon primus]